MPGRRRSQIANDWPGPKVEVYLSLILEKGLGPWFKEEGIVFR